MRGFLSTALLLVGSMLLAGDATACNPVGASFMSGYAQTAFFPQVAFASSGVTLNPAFVPFTTNVAVNNFGFRSVAFNPFVATPAFGSNVIVQNGRRNRIRSVGIGGAGFNSFGAAPGFGGTTIIQNGRRNRIR